MYLELDLLSFSPSLRVDHSNVEELSINSSFLVSRFFVLILSFALPSLSAPGNSVDRRLWRERKQS